MLFDSHAHLTHASFDRDREEIIKKLRDFDIRIIDVGADMEESEKAIGLAEKYPGRIWATAGLHPHEAAKRIDWAKLKNLAARKKVAAIGECGLDYYNLKSSAYAKASADKQVSNLKIKEIQKEIFVKQIELAKELKKPLVIHCRPASGTTDAYEDAISLLAPYNTGGVAHFFSGSKEIAKKFLDLGFYISFAGPITFAEEYREVVEYIPVGRILAETDSPFAAPLSYRGKRNEPAFVEFVIRQIAGWKEISFEEAARLTAENAANLFCLKTPI